MSIIDAKQLYGAANTIGISRAQLRALLPSWWDVRNEQTPDGLLEMILLVARRLSLDASSLAEGTIKPRGAVSSLAFKHSAATDINQLTASSLIASSLAQSILAAVSMPYNKPSSDPLAINDFVKKLGGGVADFDGLLSFCWSSGIPVISLPNIPVGLRKMDGAALMIGDRPVVVVARRNESKSWLSFILAHELGHIALGHLGRNSSIIDVALAKESTYATESSTDAQEVQADAYSLAVLGGTAADDVQRSWSARLSPVDLAVAARTRAPDAGIAPGHLVLRYAFRTKKWPVALTALKFLKEDFDAQSVVSEQLLGKLDADSLSADVSEYIEKIAGITLR